MLINSNIKSMTLKQFRNVKIVVAMVVAFLMTQAIFFNNYWLAAGTITAAILVLYFLRSRVKEIMADERDYEIAGKAARYAMTILTLVGYAIALVLMSLRKVNPLYEVIGSIISYAICVYLLCYNLIFTFLRKSLSRGRRILFYTMTVILILFFVVSGLRLFSGDEDTWLCQNGQWVRHGNPSSPMPVSECLK